MLKDDVLSSNYVSDDVRAGVSELISGEILSKIETPEAYNGTAKVTLTGTYVDEEAGIEEKINKSFDLNVDWYGSATTSLWAISNQYNMDRCRFSN